MVMNALIRRIRDYRDRRRRERFDARRLDEPPSKIAMHIGIAVALAVAFAVAGILLDGADALGAYCGVHSCNWFGRSGAFVVLCGTYLAFRSGAVVIKTLPYPGQHTLTKPQPRASAIYGVFAFALLVCGTVIWAFGDLIAVGAPAPQRQKMDWTAISAIVSAAASVLAAGAAWWAAASATRSNKQVGRERRVALEREANRTIHQVFASSTRVIELAEALKRDYTSLFAMSGRNIEAAKPLHDQVITKKAEAEVMRESAHECDWENLRKRLDSELEGYIHTMEGHLARLDKLEDSLASDRRSVEEQMRQLRERALRAHERSGPSS